MSVWEIAIKVSIGRLDLGETPAAWVNRHTSEMGLVRLAITRSAVLGVGALPFHHRDPFDRLLVSQALKLDIPMLSVDGRLRPYGVKGL